MKKRILVLFFLFAVVTVNAQSVSLSEATINPAPLDVLDNNGTGVASFRFGESTGLEVPAESFPGISNVNISVSLQYIALTEADVSEIKGTLLKYFSVSYNEASKVLSFSQNVVIPGGTVAEVSFPITVTQNSTKAQSYNVFNANINATDGRTKANGNAVVETFTIIKN